MTQRIHSLGRLWELSLCTLCHHQTGTCWSRCWQGETWSRVYFLCSDCEGLPCPNLLSAVFTICLHPPSSSQAKQYLKRIAPVKEQWWVILFYCHLFTSKYRPHKKRQSTLALLTSEHLICLRRALETVIHVCMYGYRTIQKQEKRSL